MKIKLNTRYHERTNTLYHRIFDVVNKVPEIGKIYKDYIVKSIEPFKLDTEQDPTHYIYKAFAVTLVDEEGEELEELIAIDHDDLYHQTLTTETLNDFQFKQLTERYKRDTQRKSPSREDVLDYYEGWTFAPEDFMMEG